MRETLTRNPVTRDDRGLVRTGSSATIVTNQMIQKLHSSLDETVQPVVESGTRLRLAPTQGNHLDILSKATATLNPSPEHPRILRDNALRRECCQHEPGYVRTEFDAGADGRGESQFHDWPYECRRWKHVRTQVDSRIAWNGIQLPGRGSHPDLVRFGRHH